MSQHTPAYLALGSNQGDRAAYLQAAVRALGSSQGIEVIACSPVYESAAVTMGDAQPPYLNAVLSVHTTLSAAGLLRRCLDIEVANDRVRSSDARWTQRTLDIDVLLYGTEEILESGLVVPHPRIAEREFVLRPLADLAPNLWVPGLNATVTGLLEGVEGSASRVTGVVLSPDSSEAPQAELWPGEGRGLQARVSERLPSEIRYVVIEGVIGAGKSTLTRLLARRFGAREVMEEFDENPFLARFYEDRPRWAFQTQFAFLASRFRQQQALGGPDLFHTRVISDYMFDKDRLFAQLNLSGDELQLYDTMFGIMQASIPKPDLVVYLQASTDRLMRMIARRGRSYERDMDRAYIDSLNQAYEQFFFRYNATPLLIVNTEQIDFVHSEEDLEAIVRQVAKVGYAGTTYFNPVRV
ncbi:MAG: 2-amino-4-hydroxy-6-hydroxymethyldihydropteridine diphosphokinase [Rhodothermales bacterium]|nr:2-amino-4-hydroxy-6-hydroxymethyldihydropteridine diphosphokinase [Rhodothermales bacterium]MBO6780165.1 2-amino-4-hydroxy-6-hydroxymethyldihydropteridine diphosphokinase [Rhodothermales bacterium]